MGIVAMKILYVLTSLSVMFGLAFLTFAVGYLLFWAGVFFVHRKREFKSDLSHNQTRFAFIVPAHNEEDGITATIRSLKDVSYPDAQYDVYVIADNCADRTADIARSEGAQVLERSDATLRGKGYALKFAFESLLPHSFDAFVVVDADTIVSDNFLTMLDARVRQGQKVVQAYDGLLNPDASILTYLFQVGNIIENCLFWEPKERFGFPILLRGTGMCFTREVLETYPWHAFSIVEDTEYGLKILENNLHINFASEIGVFARQPENFQQAFVQRVRWASGNSALTKKRAVGFIFKGIASGNLKLADIGVSMIVGSKPLLLFTNILIMLVAALMGADHLLAWSALLLCAQAAYIGCGVLMKGISFQKMTRLILSPFYLAWLCVVSLLGMAGFRRDQWLRTTR